MSAINPLSLSIDISGSQVPLFKSSFGYVNDKTYRVFRLEYPTTWNPSTISGLNSQNDFIVLGSNTILDGGGHQIDLSGENFTGLVLVDSSVDSFDNAPIIENIFMRWVQLDNSGATAIARGTGAVVKNNSRFFTIRNCKTLGNFRSGTSSIVGGNCGKEGHIEVFNCCHIGDCIGNRGNSQYGCIVGTAVGNNGYALIERCFQVGNINDAIEHGGIVGTNSGTNGGQVIVRNCYNIGNRTQNSGGIVAARGGSNGGELIIENCFNIGNGVGGNGQGGIHGPRPFNVKIKNCFHIGGLGGGSAGGIASTSYGSGSLPINCEIENCYVVVPGEIGGQRGGIYGPNVVTNLKIKNCYVVATGLSTDLRAGTILAQNVIAQDGGEVRVENCVTFNERFFGTNTVVDVSNNLSSDLTDISGQLYEFWTNASDNWVAVTDNSDNPYPILKAFTETPWIDTSYNQYNPTTEEAPYLSNFKESPFTETDYEKANDIPEFISDIPEIQELLRKWAGGVLASNGKIYGIPYDSSSVLIIDPLENTSNTTDISGLTGTNKWAGGVLAQNGKIYGIPYDSSSVLIIDPVANTTDKTTMSSLIDLNKWIGGVLSSNGNIYGIPSDIESVIQIKTGLPKLTDWPLQAYFNKL